MIYVLGMSHAINVLKAASVGPLAMTHQNWSEMTSAGEFFDVQAKPGLIHEGRLKAFIVSPASGWGSVAEIRTQPDGQRQVVAAEGYIKLLQSLEPVQDQGTLFSFMHGNEHSMMSLVQHDMPYDFELPWRQDLPLIAGRQPIPFEVVQRQVEKALNPAIACVAMMRSQLARMRLVHVAPPPPVASEARINQAPEVFRERIAKSGITPLSIRLKYYLLSIRMLRDALKPFNVELLECPPESSDANGAIRDELAYGATHGNEAYGELVLRQMQVLAGA
jgi:hypothetical protein